MLFLSFKDSINFAKYEKRIIDYRSSALPDSLFIQ